MKELLSIWGYLNNRNLENILTLLMVINMNRTTLQSPLVVTLNQEIVFEHFEY